MKIIKSVNKIKSVVLSFFVLFLSCSIHNIAKSQTVVSSPYSRYGIGEINNKNMGQTTSMGGTNIAVQNDSLPMFFINPGNPASYSNNRLTTAELGANFNRVRLRSTNSTGVINTASFSYITLAFPIKRWWGLSVGLIPFSNVGYRVTDEQPITNVGNVD